MMRLLCRKTNHAVSFTTGVMASTKWKHHTDPSAILAGWPQDDTASP